MSPSIACRSVAQTPAPPILMTTSRTPPGSGTGRLDELEGLVVLGEQRRLHAAAVVTRFAREVAVRVGVEVFGDPSRERHDRQRRVHGQRARDERRVADEEALDVVRLAVAVDHRPRRVVAHPAAALDVRRREPCPADLLGARRLEHPAAEIERRIESLRLDRLEVDVEALAAVLVDDHGRAVLVVDEGQQADPVPEAAHRLYEPRPPERPLLVAERRREADRILDRRRLDDEAAFLVVLEVHAVGGDRVDHVRVLRLVEEPVDETHGVQAEVLARRSGCRRRCARAAAGC